MTDAAVGEDGVGSLETYRRALTAPAVPPSESWAPVLFRVGAGQARALAELCAAHHVARFDTLERQLAELAAVRLPAGSAADRARFIAQRLQPDDGLAAVAVWAYLPWSRTVAHVLERDDWFDVITDRNRDKITRAELAVLRTKRVGVIGLSVGGEAAVTVAQEHLCGEIVLADFDRLDLSNLNRLGAGLDELGARKTTIAARRIARIDPYLSVRVFHDGVTAANVDAFLDGLDLLVEECDGLAMKFEIRRRASERGLNIVFAADERGFLSVEPHAVWPALPPFHGRIAAAQPAREAYPDALSFMRALTEWMGGWERISERSRRSLEAMGQTVCGYPQLAGEARYAAGQVAHVARRLLLGEAMPPFLGNLDLEALLENDASTHGGAPPVIPP